MYQIKKWYKCTVRYAACHFSFIKNNNPKQDINLIAGFNDYID